MHERTRQVVVIQRREVQTACLSVYHSGEAISAESIPQLFEPRSRMGQPRVQKGGVYTWGLAISGGIVYATAGKIRAESSAACGAVFPVWFQLKTSREYTDWQGKGAAR